MPLKECDHGFYIIPSFVDAPRAPRYAAMDEQELTYFEEIQGSEVRYLEATESFSVLRLCDAKFERINSRRKASIK
jgi:hypothetical protein